MTYQHAEACSLTPWKVMQRLVLCLLLVGGECQEPPSTPSMPQRPGEMWDCGCYSSNFYRVDTCERCGTSCACCYEYKPYGSLYQPLCPTPPQPPPKAPPRPKAPPSPPLPFCGKAFCAKDPAFPVWAIIVAGVVLLTILTTLIIARGDPLRMCHRMGRSGSNVPTAR